MLSTFTVSRQDYLQTFTDCEFSQGFLVLNKDSSLHVWRRRRDAAEDPLQPNLGPNPEQQEAYAKALFTLLSVSEGYRGVFVPFTVITPPRRAWSFRLVYPILLVASTQPSVAYLYDIRTGLLLHTLNFPARLRILRITSFDLSERHVFICVGDKGLLIYPRDGESVLSMIRLKPYWLMSGIPDINLYEYKGHPSDLSKFSTMAVVELKCMDVSHTTITSKKARFWKNVNTGDCLPDQFLTSS